MKVKTLSALSEKGLDKKVNEYLSNLSAEIVDIKFSASTFAVYAMMVYKERIHGN